ncbi:putative ubiquitin carboxyl-terminal hydrolase 18-like [Capsicum annuum]|nr:putative ubiquitin carboxyl-terminal hydrolase 18-like [Capsicum annuum]
MADQSIRENAAPDWECVYSYEEKRLKTLVDEDGEWEKKHHLWEIQNGLVPIYDEVFTPEERELEEKRKRKREILSALELGHKRRIRRHKKRHSIRGWDLAYYDIPDGKFPSPLPTASLTPEFWKQLYEYVRKPSASVTQTTGSSTPVNSNLATEKRCCKNLYATPYCKCDPNCREYYDCFDIDDYFDGRLHPLRPFKEIGAGKAEIIMELANHAIQEYNEKESNVFKYSVLKIEKVNCSIALYDTYWMTVIVTNLILVTPIETFQIHAAFTSFNDDSKVYCCGPKEEPIIGLPSCEFCFGLLPEGRVMGGRGP